MHCGLYIQHVHDSAIENYSMWALSLPHPVCARGLLKSCSQDLFACKTCKDKMPVSARHGTSYRLEH